MHPPHRIPAPRTQSCGQLGEPRRQPGRILARQLPGHRAPARLPVGVLHRHTGLARTPQPAQHHHPRTRPPPRQAGIQPTEQLLPARQEHRPRRQPHRHPGTTRPRGPAARRLLQVRQRLEQAHLQFRGRTHELDRDPGVLHPLPERPLPLPEHRIGQKHSRQRQHRVLIQHKHQPGQAQLPGRGELQLGIRMIRVITDRRPVPEPDDADINIGPPDLLAAVVGGLIFAGGEIRHVQNHTAGAGHSVLRCGDERPPRRILAQLGGMTQEHPQRPLHKRSRYRYPPAMQPQPARHPSAAYAAVRGWS